MFEVKIFIETSIRGPAVRTGAGMYIIEYIKQSGEAETRSGILVREKATENALALAALDGAFRRLTKTCSAGVTTECQHILNVMWNHYLPVWEKNGWFNAKGNPVANKELWQKVSGHVKDHTVSFGREESIYRKRMRFDTEKAVEAFKDGREYHPAERYKRVPAVPDGSGEYWVLW